MGYKAGPLLQEVLENKRDIAAGYPSVHSLIPVLV